MSRDLEGAVLLVLGVVVARVTLEGSYLAYVKSSLYWPLVATSVMLLVLGFATLRRQPSGHHQASPAATDPAATSVAQPHSHRPPRSGVLLLFPVVVLVLAAPPPLGAFAAGRGSVNTIAEDIAADLPALERHGSDPVELTISEFVLRTHAMGDASVRGVPVRLIGFVAHREGSDDAFLLSRFAVACCAADATPRQVLVEGGIPPDEDVWAEVVVVWDGPTTDDDGDRIPEVAQQELEVVDPPASPYEYAVY